MEPISISLYRSLMSEGRQTMLTDFVPVEKIGEGSFSTVYKVRRISDGEFYALKKVKMVKLKQKEKKNALNQVRILASVDSPFVIGYKEAFFDQHMQVLCIVMEWANEQDLQKQIDSHKKDFRLFDERAVWEAASQIIQGLHYLHERGILHRDIKTANIFRSQGVYKLGDLNVSKIQTVEDRLAYTQTGTPYYASPEVWRDQPYGLKSDIWSLGCVLYEMCALKPPFRGKDLEALYRVVQRGLFDPIPSQFSADLFQLIGQCLRKNAQDRLDTSQLLSVGGILYNNCLKHEIGLQISRPRNINPLLETIRLPANLSQLHSQLPRPQYSLPKLPNHSSSQSSRPKLARLQFQRIGLANANASSYNNKKSQNTREGSSSERRKQNSSLDRQVSSMQLKTPVSDEGRMALKSRLFSRREAVQNDATSIESLPYKLPQKRETRSVRNIYTERSEPKDIIRSVRQLTHESNLNHLESPLQSLNSLRRLFSQPSQRLDDLRIDKNCSVHLRLPGEREINQLSRPSGIGISPSERMLPTYMPRAYSGQNLNRHRGSGQKPIGSPPAPFSMRSLLPEVCGYAINSSTRLKRIADTAAVRKVPVIDRRTKLDRARYS